MSFSIVGSNEPGALVFLESCRGYRSRRRDSATVRVETKAIAAATVAPFFDPSRVQMSPAQAAVALFAEEKVHRATQREQNEEEPHRHRGPPTSTIPDSDLRTRKQPAANVRPCARRCWKSRHFPCRLVAESDSPTGVPEGRGIGTRREREPMHHPGVSHE